MVTKVTIRQKIAASSNEFFCKSEAEEKFTAKLVKVFKQLKKYFTMPQKAASKLQLNLLNRSVTFV